MTINELRELMKGMPGERKITIKKYHDTGNKDNECIALHLTEDVFVVLEEE